MATTPIIMPPLNGAITIPTILDVVWLQDIIQYALKRHENQRDKYVDSGYYRHLAEVAALTAMIDPDLIKQKYGFVAGRYQIALFLQALGWGHDLIEDTGGYDGKTHLEIYSEIRTLFGQPYADSIAWLTDQEWEGNRAVRKAQAAVRMGNAPGFIQSVKYCDCMSNTRTIARYDEAFAGTYLDEIRHKTEFMIEGDRKVRDMLLDQLNELGAYLATPRPQPLKT